MTVSTSRYCYMPSESSFTRWNHSFCSQTSHLTWTTFSKFVNSWKELSYSTYVLARFSVGFPLSFPKSFWSVLTIEKPSARSELLETLCHRKARVLSIIFHRKWSEVDSDNTLGATFCSASIHEIVIWSAIHTHFSVHWSGKSAKPNFCAIRLQLYEAPHGVRARNFSSIETIWSDRSS